MAISATAVLDAAGYVKTFPLRKAPRTETKKRKRTKLLLSHSPRPWKLFKT